jgi:hypothetical protein
MDSSRESEEPRIRDSLLRTLVQMERNFFYYSSLGDLRIIGGLQIEADGFQNITTCLFQRVSLRYASRESGNEYGISTFVRWFENNFEMHV